MPPEPVPPVGVLTRVANGWHAVKRAVYENVNFFRLHVAAFVFVPLILGSIMYAANGKFTIGYLDMLFIAYSAMAGCGLSTVNLSTLTAFQQSVLFILMQAGHYGVVSYLMVLARKRYFQTRCARFARVFGHKSRSVRQVGRDLVSRFSPVSTPVVAEQPAFIFPESSNATESSRPRRVRALSTGAEPLSRSFTFSFLPRRRPVSPISEKPQLPRQVLQLRQEMASGVELELPTTPTRSSAAFLASSPMHSDDPSSMRVQFLDSPMLERTHSHVSSIRSPIGGQFAITSSPRSLNSHLPGDDIMSIRSSNGLRRRPTVARPTPPVRGATILSTPTTQTRARHHEHGGIPTLSLITTGLGNVAKKAAPNVYRTLERKLTTNVTPHVIKAPILKSAQPAPKPEGSEDSNWADEVGEALEEAIEVMKSKVERWVTFDGLKVFRNSEFGMDDLTDEQFEEIGGIEYKALRLLSYLVPLYVIGVQLFCFLLIAPWLASTSRYDPVFDAQPRMIDKTWFSAFQVVGAYTGGGFSLSDLSMVPFQSATLMIWSLIFGILAGNHAFPIFLRLTIWICTKFCKEGSPTDRTLHFLLDHPRRCFIYLFPCQQTWFLVVVLVFFSVLEWAAFLVLNIGLDVTESIALPRRVLLGLFQGIAARASGFAIISVGALAPAVIFLYIVMMYIAVFPLAMAIRGTNVYEERSLGIYQAPESEEPQLDGETKSREAVSKYLSWHLKKQLAFDLWWLVLGIFLVCIIERKMLMDDDLAPWFNLFRVVFELVSAYGGVGLSLGIPTENYSFCGAFKPLSKVVIIFVMVRGRHRGLPMAVDRAVMLPEEFSAKPSHELQPSGQRSRAHTLP